MRIATIAAAVLLVGAANAATPDFSLTLGAGKALNNTNTRLPGWLGSIRGNVSLSPKTDAFVGYTRLGASFLAENAAISYLGIGYKLKYAHIGLGLITGASYSAAVWWDKDKPDQTCGVEGCGIRYENNGTVFSRACHLCGGVLSVDYDITKRLGVRAEYYGLRHMEPTFQGTVIQITWRIL
jgi:hypothetical protein